MNDLYRHVIFLSGGLNSFLSAWLVIKNINSDAVLVFCDTKNEDEDLYRFLNDIEILFNKKIIWLQEGRDIWQVFFDVRMLGNSRIDPCSRILKREISKKWAKNNCYFKNNEYKTELYFGIDWTEAHRILKIQNNWDGFIARFPLIENNIFNPKEEAKIILKYYNIEIPRLYKMGFHHNNCGGFCVKSGHGGFATLLKNLPERYAYHENKENEFRNYIGKNVTIMRDGREGKTKPLTMSEFRMRFCTNNNLDLFNKKTIER